MLFQFTACVTGAGAGVDSAWEQEKLEARKMSENATESPASSARCVGRFLAFMTFSNGYFIRLKEQIFLI